jgi:tRNA A-37 threonylcarbamoyl transferase component Bud32
VVVKEFFPVSLRRRLRKYARTESERALAASARGIPIVEPLAWARLRDGRQLLILKDEVGARPLKEIILDGSVSGAERHQLAQRVGELFARLQNEGFRHTDPHPGNILVRPDGSVLFSDAFALEAGDYPRLGDRAEDLARFALYPFKHCSRIDLLLFWGAYGRTSGFAPAELEEFRNDVLQRVPGAFRRLVRTRARKTRRKGRPFRYATWAGSVPGDIEDEQLQRIVTRATHLSDGPDILKSSPTCWTFAFEEDWVVKAYQPKKAGRGLRDLFQGTRAQRAVERSEAFFRRGLVTAKVIAYLEDGAVPDRSILVQERVCDAKPADEVLPDLDPLKAREAAALIGRTLRRMHDWGLRNRDLKRDNLWLTLDGEGVIFLDLDGVRQTRSGTVDWEKRAQDLAHFDGSILDRNAVPTGLRLRALDAYIGANLPANLNLRAFVRKVAQLAQTSRERRLQRRAESPV